MTRMPPIPSAPEYSEIYRQQSPSRTPSSTLVQAQAVSFHRTYEGNTTDSTTPNHTRTQLITIPSANVLLEKPENEGSAPIVQYSYVSTDPPSQVEVVVGEVLPERRFRGQIVKAKNAHLPDNVLAFKQARETRTALSAWTGGIIGFFTLGPFGAVLGAYSAYGIAKSVGKAKERQLIRQAGLVQSSSLEPVVAGLVHPSVEPVVAVTRPQNVTRSSSTRFV